MARPSAAGAGQAGVPLHHQIYLHLRAQILDGSWVGREGFPGEEDLARQFGVSAVTARTALNRLAADGFIQRSRGRRPKVVREPDHSRRDNAPAVIQTSIGAPRAFTYRVLSRGEGVAPLEACEAFGLPPGSDLWLYSRLRTYRGRPHSVTLNAQRIELGRSLPIDKLRKLPMTQVLRDAGVKFAYLRRRITASLPPPHIAAQLGVMLHDPTLVYTFTHHDSKDLVVQWVRIWVRHDEPSPEEVFSYETGNWSMSTSM